MALFKISKGLKDDLVAQKPTEGFCWFTTDDGKFYIDTATSADPAIVGTNRIPLNAYEADKIIQNGSDGPFFVTTTGTAAVTTTGALNSVVWTGTTAHGTDDFDTLTTGLMIMVKFPTAGHSYGITLNVNGLGAKPLVYNNAKMRTHYDSGTAMLFMYDAASPALSGFYNNNAAVSYAANYGCWRAMADYDTTNIYQLRNSGAGHLAQNKLYRYQLLLTSATNTSALIPINSVSNNTGTSKTLTTDKFNPFGPIYYYATTSSVNAGDGISSSYVYVHYVLDLRYSFNTGSTLVQRQAVFIVAEPQADGSAVLHTDPISQTLPSTDNGLIYIYVGQATSTTSVELALQHPVYQYKNGHIQAYTGGVDSLQATGTAPLTLSVSNNKNVYTISGSIADATQSASGLLTAADKTKLDGIETGAEVNQDAFAHIKIGDTYITADRKADTVEFVGSNITLTPDNANDKLTIGLTSTNVTTALGYTPPQQDTTYSTATQSDDGLMSAADKTKLDGISTGAEVNQNAFGKVKVGSDTIEADIKIDTLELAGSNVTLTPDTTNDKVTIGITSANVVAALGYTPPQQDTTYSDATQSTHGLMSTTDKVKLDGIATGAEVNQNTFSNIKVGNETVAADAKTDTVEFTGTNVTITPDTTNDKINFQITSANVTTALGYTPPQQDTTYNDATQSTHGLMSTTDKEKLDGIATGAEVNQNAFSKVAVSGQTTIEADGKTDTLNLAGSNVTITTNATDDTVTIGLTQSNVTAALGYTPPTQDTTYGEATQSTAGLMSATDKTKLDGVATGAEVNQNAFSKIAVSGQITVEADAKTDTLTLAGDNVTISTTANTDTVTIGLTSANVITALGYTPPQQDTTYSNATQSAAGLMSSTDKTKLDGIETGAEINQNAFSYITVGDDKVEASTKTDGVEFQGSNITITPDVHHNIVEFGVTQRNALTALGMKIFFGECTTVASTAKKDVVCPGFTADDLVTGTAIWVRFTNTNSASVSSLKLAVNNTTEKPIKYMYNASVSNLPGEGYLLGGQTYLFHYDGTNWVIDNLHYNTNTTYSSMSQTEAETGTATSARLITAARLKNTILYHAPSGSNTTPAMDGTAAVGTETTWAHGDHVHPTDTTRAAVATTVTNVAWDTTNNKLTQTINGTTSDIVTASTLKTALGLSSAMLFMGSLGTNGTITTLPAAAAGNQGYTYKVITAGTYADQAAQVGDVFISTGTGWELVPSGDEPVGTVTSVAASGSGGITISGSPITSSGTITVGLNLSTAINGLGEGTAAANRNDYVVAQYAGGGTSNTTYYRRKVSNILAAMNSSDVTTALGYTPYNSSNPNGYTSNEGTVTEITAGAGLNTTSDDTDSDGGTISTSGTLYLTKTGVTANSYGPSANASPAHAGTFSVPYITVDKYGRVTAASTKTITLPSDNNTDTKVRQSATTTSDWRKILLHYTNQSSATAAVQDVTNETYAAVDVAVQPSTATVRAKKFMVAGTAGATNTITSDATTNMYFVVNSKTPLVITDTAVRSGASYAGTIDLGTTSNKWNKVYANYFYGDGSNLTNLPTTYWANIATTSAAAYDKAPEVASIKIGNGTTATATKGVTLQYNTTTNALDFIFM